MAAQKAEARKRLFRQQKRTDGDISELEKKKQSLEKRKEELVCTIYLAHLLWIFSLFCNLR